MKSLVVEGWRHIPHSYAMVNQCQCLELLRRPGIRLFHRELPLASPSWKPGPGLFAPDEESRLRSIPAPPAGLRPDAVLRMGWPHFLHADPSGAPTFVWGTSEVLLIEDYSIGVRRPAREVLPGTKADIIACSHWAAKGFINSGAPAERVSVVPCGANPEVFHPVPLQQRDAYRRQFGWEGRFVLLNISAMTPNKGVDHLLRAAAALVPSHPNLLVVLKGSDALYPSEQLAKAAASTLPPHESQQVLSRVAYVGATLNTDFIARLYQSADLYVSPYLAEGFNLPVLEAAASGLPVICTRGGATEDFVDDSFALRIDSDLVDCDPPTAKALAPRSEHLVSLLSRAIEDGEFRAKAREAGPEWVRSRFTWKHSVDKLLAKLFPEGVD